MNSYELIVEKLRNFIRKFYVNEIIKGAILFFALGLLYFLFTVVLEYFLWFNVVGRAVLFWLFVVVECALLFKFVGIPLARLFKLFSGIAFRDASSIIGNHFPEVSDKLVNILQLREQGGDDELTWAGILQKSEELKPIPFSLAINLKHNVAYLKYLAVPLLIIIFLMVSGNDKIIYEGANRVVDYNTTYVPPAPFSFNLETKNLTALQKRDFKLQVRVTGIKIPESVSVIFNEQSYYMTQESVGNFSFVFKSPENDIPFTLVANGISSHPYLLKVNSVPVINSFELAMTYPAHTGKVNDVLKSTGNAVVPEGTRVTWKLVTTATDRVEFTANARSESFRNVGNEFAFAKAITSQTKYAITTSNKVTQNFEELRFQIDVIKDEFPELTIQQRKDSINTDMLYFKGQAADDYGIKMMQLVYYAQDNPTAPTIYSLGNNRGTFDEFLLAFPGDIALRPGVAYEYYFEVIDNDAVNNFKCTKSEVFSYRTRTVDEEKENQLSNQKESLSNMQRSLEEQKQQQQQLDKLSQEQLEKQQRSFNDKRKLDQALKNQVEQEKKMRLQMERLKDNFEKSPLENNPEKQALEDRMQKGIEELKNNEELLKKIQEYQEKLSPEELKDQLDKAKKNTKNQQRSLQQLLELTKRFYVKQKFEQLGDKLSQIADKQSKQSEKSDTENKKSDQDALNKDFDNWLKELRELEKENDGLKEPMSLDFDPDAAFDIKQEQKDASKKLEERNAAAAKKDQKSAAQKMKELSAAMSAQSQEMAGEGAQEDASALRQILDNLVVYSKEQEKLIATVRDLNRNSPNYGKKLKVQKDLETAFKHVDDSLFALASRNPKIGENINKEVTDVFYYIEKSLAQLSDFETSRAVVSQQFAFKGANTLANMLSDSLDNMNEELSMSGKGKSSDSRGFQLPDIIKKQESLSKGEEKGDSGKQPGKDGKDGKEGSKGDAPGQQGQDGKSGDDGQSGQDGKSGQDGQRGSDGKGGKNGQSAQHGQSGQQGSGTQQGQGNSNQGSGSKQGRGDGNGDGGTGNGQEKNRKTGSQGYRESESEAQRVMEIYKQQQDIRNQLENLIRQEGLEGKLDNLTNKMKSVERKLLDQGFNREVQQRMMDIQYDLLKVKDAGLLQGKEEKREATTNKKEFNSNNVPSYKDAMRYFDNKEILNRQVLPLQPQYRNRVKDYFKQDD